jgi:cytochrome c2
MPSQRAKAAAVVLLATFATVVVGAAHYWRDQQTRTKHAVAMTGGNPERAMQAMRYYGCAACHAIPGSRVPGGLAAPPLQGISERLYLGGVVANTPDNLVRWIVNPKQFSPHTAMPITGISERDARDVAAYLYSRL